MRFIMKRCIQIIMITAIVIFLMLISASKAELLVIFFSKPNISTVMATPD